MRLQVLRALMLVLGLLLWVQIRAEEGEEAKPKAGAAAPGADYAKKEGRLNSLRNKIGELEKKFQLVGEEIVKTRDENEKRRLSEDLVAIAKDRNNATKEYESLRLELRFKYPAKGESLERRYLPMKEKKVEELAQPGSSLDEQLTILKRKIDQKYRPLMPKESTANKEQPTSANEAAGDSPEAGPEKKRLKLVK